MMESPIALVLAAAIAVSAPLLFAAIGELVSETAGVLNLELEGIMLSGAFAGILAAQLSGNLAIALMGAMLGGLLVAVLHGIACFIFRANQIVSGIGLNILALGFTSFAAQLLLDPLQTVSGGRPPNLSIPLLSDIPIVGPILFEQNVMVYAAYAAVPVTYWLLTRTHIGLSLRAAGENPEAAESLSVNVGRVRGIALAICGIAGGLGGAALALAGLGFFTQNITAGRGFIAIAAVVFGRWQPVGTMLAVLLFAIADAVQIRAQALGLPVPYQALVALPYVVTLVALAGFVRRSRAPSALAENYFPEG